MRKVFKRNFSAFEVVGMLVVVMMGVALYAHAITIPNTFKADTTARASEVNANFQAVNAFLPIAYGFINSDGTTNDVTPNVASTWEAANSRYLITITGESYHWDDYVTVVTVSDPTPGAPLIATVNSIGGQLAVYVYDAEGNSVQANFQFVTFKP